MKTVYSVKEAQKSMAQLLRTAESGRMATVTRHDKTVAYLIGAEQLNAMVETMEILADPEAMQAIRKAREGKGTYFTLDEIPD
jgi:antitoxin (DNA-binding transcriptional repressor) of toxin-antitoxin stability system